MTDFVIKGDEFLLKPWSHHLENLYPPIEPNRHFMLKVSELHTLYVEECGNPNGEPVIFLHGGPGGGCSADHRRYFHPEKYRIILFDQRGCGRSLPFSELKENTTWDLVADIEKIREELKIEKWAVFGGSWGSTLALAYAQAHPKNISYLFLRGIFMLRKKELHWFYQEGASKIYPDEFDAYRDHIPSQERGDLMGAYYKRLTSDDAQERQAAAKTWSIWEGMTSRLIPDSSAREKFGEDAFADAFARIECHYFMHGGFFEQDDQLLARVEKIRHIPCFIVHGRYDVVCPLENAWELKKAWPEAELKIIDQAGHTLAEPLITEALIKATNRFVGVS
jgi:proline iminopeptidase